MHACHCHSPFACLLAVKSIFHYYSWQWRQLRRPQENSYLVIKIQAGRHGHDHDHGRWPAMHDMSEKASEIIRQRTRSAEETRWRLAWPYEWCGDGQPEACHCLTARAAGATRTWARCRRAGAACLSVALPWCLVPTLMRHGMMDGWPFSFLNPDS